MAESIQNRKLQQTSYLREIQQEKAARKRELMSQQQQEILDVREKYAEENRRLESESADAVNHIRNETYELQKNYSETKRQEQQELKDQHYAEIQAQRDSKKSQSVIESSSEQKMTYNRSGLKKPLFQSAESSKENDPFYKVQNRGSRVSENRNQYVIEAYAPEHEKDNLKVSVQRNKAIISGKRQFGDTADLGERKLSTNNFQSFREEFKFNKPVSHDGMTRERVGDYVRFTIPKLESIDNEEV